MISLYKLEIITKKLRFLRLQINHFFAIIAIYFVRSAMADPVSWNLDFLMLFWSMLSNSDFENAFFFLAPGVMVTYNINFLPEKHVKVKIYCMREKKILESAPNDFLNTRVWRSLGLVSYFSGQNSAHILEEFFFSKVEVVLLSMNVLS